VIKKSSCKEIEVGLKSCKEIGVELCIYTQGECAKGERAKNQSINAFFCMTLLLVLLVFLSS
jgi:hypothetical protein